LKKRGKKGKFDEKNRHVALKMTLKKSKKFSIISPFSQK